MPKVNIVQDVDKAAIREQYQTAITRLEQIEAYADLPANPTNAQVIAALRLVISAVKDIAKFLRLLLKFIARNL